MEYFFDDFSLVINDKYIDWEKRETESRNYMYYLSQKPKFVERKVKAFKEILSKIEPWEIQTVQELFGGIGLLYTLIQGSSINSHVKSYHLNDWNSNCVNHLQEMTANDQRVRVTAQDVFSNPNMIDTVDFLSHDYDMWTYNRAVTKYHELTNALFDSESKYIQITDAATNLLHLHYKTYTKLTGSLVDTPSAYIDNCIKPMATFKGYTLIDYSTHGFSYYLFKRREN